MASNSYFFPPNQQDPLQLSLKSPSTQLTFSTAPCISSHFCFSFLQKSCFSSQLTSTACSLSQKCLFHNLLTPSEMAPISPQNLPSPVSSLLNSLISSSSPTVSASSPYVSPVGSSTEKKVFAPLSKSAP